MIATLLINARTERQKNQAVQDAADRRDALDRARVLEDRQAIVDDTTRKINVQLREQADITAQQVATVASRVAADQSAAAEVVAADGRHLAKNLAAAMQTSQRQLTQQVTDAETAATVARASLAAHLAQVQKDLLANTEHLAHNTALTQDAKTEAAAARIESNGTNERLLVVDKRLIALDERIDRTATLVELFAAERARSLAAEGAVHLADADRITAGLTIKP